MAPAGGGGGGGGVGTYGDIARGGIGEAAGAGLFSLRGSPLLMAMRRRMALRNARNRLRQGQTTASLAGLDPAAQRQALVDLNRNVSGQTADYLNAGQEQDIQGSADFLRGLYGQERGYEEQRLAAERDRKEARRGRLGALLGTLGGSILGGPIGGAIGSGIGGLFDSRGGGGGGGGSDAYYRTL